MNFGIGQVDSSIIKMPTVTSNTRGTSMDVTAKTGDLPQDGPHDKVQCDSIRVGISQERNETELAQQLIDVDEELGHDDLEGLKFLCRDHIPVAKLEKAQSALELFEFLKKSLMISMSNVEFLLECLGRIHRFDLVKKFGCDVDKIRQALPQLNRLFPFRILLMNLAEDLDASETEKIRFFLKGKIKKKQLNEKKTLLELFVFMEQECVLAPDKLDLLIAVMDTIKRADLSTTIRKFRGEQNLSRPEAQVHRCNSLPSVQQKALTIGSSAHAFEIPLTTGGKMERNTNSDTTLEPVKQQSALQQGGHSQNVAQILGNRMIDRSVSAGTLVVTSSHSSSNDIEMEVRGTIPEPLLVQIAMDLKSISDDVAMELGFTNDEIAQFNILYPDPGLRTQIILDRWQASKTDRGSIATVLLYLLQKCGCKSAADALRNFIAGFDNMLGSQTTPSTKGHEAQPPLPTNPIVQNIQNGTNIQELIQGAYNSGPIPSQRLSSQVHIVGQIPNGFPMCSASMLPVASPNVQMFTTMPICIGPLPQIQLPSAQINNTQGLDVDLPVYKMDRKPRGWCVIINNDQFYVLAGDNESKPMGARAGSHVDAESLQVVFERLGFLVQRRDNLSDTEMMGYLVDVAHNVNHADFDCFVCCILTHGILNSLYGANGHLVSIKDVTSTFQANRCQSLAGKPKLFFLQACQGTEKMSGGTYEEPEMDNPTAVGTSSLEVDNNDHELIPNEADFLIGYATVPGYASFRSKHHGSWYIRKLCELLVKHSAREDLISILVEVNREVARANAKFPDGLFKQIPAPLVTLRKKLYFH